MCCHSVANGLACGRREELHNGSGLSRNLFCHGPGLTHTARRTTMPCAHQLCSVQEKSRTPLAPHLKAGVWTPGLGLRCPPSRCPAQVPRSLVSPPLPGGLPARQTPPRSCPAAGGAGSGGCAGQRRLCPGQGPRLHEAGQHLPQSSLQRGPPGRPPRGGAWRSAAPGGAAQQGCPLRRSAHQRPPPPLAACRQPCGASQGRSRAHLAGKAEGLQHHRLGKQAAATTRSLPALDARCGMSSDPYPSPPGRAALSLQVCIDSFGGPHCLRVKNESSCKLLTWRLAYCASFLLVPMEL